MPVPGCKYSKSCEYCELCPCCKKGCPVEGGHHGKFDWKALLFILIFIPITVGIIALVETTPWLKYIIETYVHNKQTVLAFALIFGGLFLFILREIARVWYGSIELVFAFVYGYHSLTRLSEVGAVEVLGVIASVYLTVRGLDNIYQHLLKSRERYFAEEAAKKVQEDEELLYEVMPYYR